VPDPDNSKEISKKRKKSGRGKQKKTLKEGDRTNSVSAKSVREPRKKGRDREKKSYKRWTGRNGEEGEKRENKKRDHQH